MRFWDFLFPKIKPTSAIIPEDPVVEKVTILTVTKQPPKDYLAELPAITIFFGKLYKYLYKDTIWESFNTLKVSVPVGVYYGYTKYTGETNRNRVKAVALIILHNLYSLVGICGKSMIKPLEKTG